MVEFSLKTTGTPVSYIELSSGRLYVVSFFTRALVHLTRDVLVAVTIVQNESYKVFCAIFHDTSDGCIFASFIAKELLDSFVSEYGTELSAVGHNLRDFHRFQYKIAMVVRDSTTSILRKRTIPSTI